MLKIPIIDVVALIWFVACWVGYTWFTSRKAFSSPSLLLAMRAFRHDWFTHMLARENRVGDIVALNNLSAASTFLASTCILILGGLAALLGTTEQAINVVSTIPFTRQESELVWRLKIILLIVVFVYAFFKFTWSIRQYNFCVVLVGAAPKINERPESHDDFIEIVTNIASFSAENFNQGLRGYYFALGALTWFLHPWLFVLSSALVVFVLYQREFQSRTLQVLLGRLGAGYGSNLAGNQSIQPRASEAGQYTNRAGVSDDGF